ncbi:MAG: hypothetical protein V4564_20880 [Pseudomonadota bacterium]
MGAGCCRFGDTLGDLPLLARGGDAEAAAGNGGVARASLYLWAKPKPAPGLPTREQILDFIATSNTLAGKREIAKAFGQTSLHRLPPELLRRLSPEDRDMLAGIARFTDTPNFEALSEPKIIALFGQ